MIRIWNKGKWNSNQGKNWITTYVYILQMGKILIFSPTLTIVDTYWSDCIHCWFIIIIFDPRGMPVCEITCVISKLNDVTVYYQNH